MEKNGRLAYIVFPVAGFNGSICIRGSLKIDGLLEMLFRIDRVMYLSLTIQVFVSYIL